MASQDTAQQRAQAADTVLSGELRAMFDKVAGQPIPEHLLELVDALEQKRRREEKRS